MNSAQKITIRPAVSSDVSLIYNFIKSLGYYENATEKDMPLTPELLKENLFEKKYAESLIAYLNDLPVGLAIYFHNFSTWLSKPGIWIEDLFVLPEYRKKGVGKKLIVEITKIAKERKCGRVDWNCLNWNEPGLQFYKKIGAKACDDWILHRLDEEGINRVVESEDSNE